MPRPTTPAKDPYEFTRGMSLRGCPEATLSASQLCRRDRAGGLQSQPGRARGSAPVPPGCTTSPEAHPAQSVRSRATPRPGTAAERPPRPQGTCCQAPRSRALQTSPPAPTPPAMRPGDTAAGPGHVPRALRCTPPAVPRRRRPRGSALPDAPAAAAASLRHVTAAAPPPAAGREESGLRRRFPILLQG